MKKSMLVVMLMMLLGMTAVVNAESIKLNLGIIKVDLQGDVNAIGLVDFCHNNQILSGVVTSVAKIPINKIDLDLSAGVVTGSAMSNIPVLSLGYRWQVTSSSFLQKFGLDNLYAGIGAGYYFNEIEMNKSNNVVGGITLSTNILKF